MHLVKKLIKVAYVCFSLLAVKKIDAMRRNLVPTDNEVAEFIDKLDKAGPFTESLHEEAQDLLQRLARIGQNDAIQRIQKRLNQFAGEQTPVTQKMRNAFNYFTSQAQAASQQIKKLPILPTVLNVAAVGTFANLLRTMFMNYSTMRDYSNRDKFLSGRNFITCNPDDAGFLEVSAEQKIDWAYTGIMNLGYLLELTFFMSALPDIAVKLFKNGVIENRTLSIRLALLSGYFDINKPIKFKELPIDIILRHDRLELIPWLLEYGLDISVKDAFGKTAKDYLALTPLDSAEEIKRKSEILNKVLKYELLHAQQSGAPADVATQALNALHDFLRNPLRRRASAGDTAPTA